jgi:hypothetical protein
VVRCRHNARTPASLRVFVKALMLADTAGVSEISVDMLLAALDCELSPPKVQEPLTGDIVPVPRRELALSNEAKAAMVPLGDIFGITPEALRSALLCTRGGDAQKT